MKLRANTYAIQITASSIQVPIAYRLPPDEGAELARCETIIQTGLENSADAFIEGSQALHSIRVRRLYRMTHSTFRKYCRERWGFQLRRAQQVADAGGVVLDLKLAVGGSRVENVNPGSHPVSGLLLPRCEKHARPLVPLEPAARHTAWQKAIDLAGGRYPSLEMIILAVGLFRQEPQANGEGIDITPDAVPDDDGHILAHIRRAIAALVKAANLVEPSDWTILEKLQIASECLEDCRMELEERLASVPRDSSAGSERKATPEIGRKLSMLKAS